MKDILSITKGNDFALLLDLTRKLPVEDSVPEPVVDSTTDVYILTSCGERITVPQTAVPHTLGWQLVTVNDRLQIAITFPASEQHIDRYGLEVKGIAAGENWRYKGKPGEVIEIVDATSDQNIPDDQVRIYAIGAVIGIGSQSQDMTGYATEQWVQQQGYLTQHQNISHLEGKILLEEKSTASFNAETGIYYRCTYNGAIAVTLPSMSAGEQYLKGLIVFATASADDSITFTANDGKTIIKAEGYKIEAGCTYEINCVFNGVQWVVTAVKFES